jgi:uncharacterized protein YgbK (DUF1537 family)
VTTVRVIADDLTGALDSAAPLTRLSGPMPVIWCPEAIPQHGGSFALDTESRDIPTVEATWLAAFEGTGLAYKKVDSLLRGNTVNEVAACLTSGLFASAVIAPAFPAQQRITQHGQQYWRANPGEAWQAVACDLDAGLQARGIHLRRATSPNELAGQGHFLCDATTEDGLAALVATGGRLAGPLLWCGSGGLARALAGDPIEPRPYRLESPLLMVIGSHHPITLKQVRTLTDRMPGIVLRVRPEDGRSPVIDDLARILGERGRSALVLEVPDGTGAKIAAPFFDRILAAATERMTPARSLLVTGGATLRRLMNVLGARSLLVRGELSPGVPRSLIRGGRWDGTVVISKSGAFGDPGLLIRLAESAKGAVHE